MAFFHKSLAIKTRIMQLFFVPAHCVFTVALYDATYVICISQITTKIHTRLVFASIKLQFMAAN